MRLRWPHAAGIAALAAVAYLAFAGRGKGEAQIEYRYAPAFSGEILRSTSAVGTLVPLTKVDVKSKAGGRVTRLAVEEGSVVQKGDVVAWIDPRDTRTTYDQAKADLDSASARAEQARLSAELEDKTARTRVREAEVSLASARLRLESARANAEAQPGLTRSSIAAAQASVRSAEESLRLYREVTAPQTRKDVEGQASRAEADLVEARDEMARQERLYAKGYVSLASVQRQRTALATAEAAAATARQRRDTLDAEVDANLRASEARLRQAQEALAQEEANAVRDRNTARDQATAQAAVRAAEIALAKARDDLVQVQIRRSEVRNAVAGTVRSRVAVQNAQTQLSETTVLAPRDGVVTVKYLEEGTIVPPGTSTFAQGTSIVQIADVSRMFVECPVDEADIGSVRTSQPVRIVVEAYPGKSFRGVVRRVFPAAETTQSVTTVKVLVEVTGRPQGAKDTQLRPGMNATCEFVQFELAQALQVPQQAVRRDGERTFVLVKSSDPKKPERRAVKLGQEGNETVVVLDGLREGEEVVIAEIDLTAMRDRQQRMEQAAQGGGFGSVNRGGPSQSRASGGGSGGGGGR